MPAVFSLAGLVAGVVIGLVCPGTIPRQYTVYVAVGLLAAMDSVFGGMNAGLQRKFSTGVFVSGFFINTALAALLTYFGSMLQIDLYLAAVVVFGTRIFQNLAEIRRYVLNNTRKNSKITL